MPNEGFFELGLLDVRAKPAADPDTDVRFFRASDGKQIAVSRELEFPPNRRFPLPAFPQEQNLYCDVAPSRYRMRSSGFFTLTDGETITRNLTVFRNPSKWKARFERWNGLPPDFDPLKLVLANSPGLKVKQGRLLGNFTDAVYDDVDDTRTIRAKASMLNLFAKLTALEAPTAAGPWFSFVQRILEIGQERFIAIVGPKMGQIVRKIKDNIDRFKDYKHTPAQNHHGNMPKDYAVPKSKMFSVKSREDLGNIQLTLAPATDPGGNEVLLLDVDIDENGRLLEHLADLFKHKFTGGTDPFDIHEFLSLSHPNVPLGYELV